MKRALILIGIVAAVLRFYPIWFGLPYLRARPDEETAIARAIGVLGGDPNPHFFHWPSLTFYMFALAYAVASAGRGLLGFSAPLSGSAHLLIGRAVTAAAGTASVLLLFRMADRMGGRLVGLMAAAFLSVAVLHVRESHFAMTDVVMTLLIVWSLSLLLSAIDSPSVAGGSLRRFAAAGIAGGLAASTKYSAAIVVVAMAAAQVVWLRQCERKTTWRAWLPAVSFLTAFVAAFIAGTPYAILDLSTFLGDVRFDATHLSTGHGIDLGRGWTLHARRSLPYGIGMPIFIGGVIGLGPLAFARKGQGFVLAVFGAAFYAIIGSGQTVFFRYVLPLVPIVCLSAALAVDMAARLVAARSSVAHQVVVVALAGMMLVPVLARTIWMDVLMGRTDTRVLAGRWLISRLQPDDTLHDGGGDYVRLDLARVRFHPWYFNPTTRSFGDPAGRTPDWLVLYDSPLQVYGVSSPELRRLAADRYVLVRTFSPGDDSQRAVYDQQDAFFLPIAGFSGIARPGPRIEIYRRRDAVLR